MAGQRQRWNRGVGHEQAQAPRPNRLLATSFTTRYTYGTGEQGMATAGCWWATIVGWGLEPCNPGYPGPGTQAHTVPNISGGKGVLTTVELGLQLTGADTAGLQAGITYLFSAFRTGTMHLLNRRGGT